MAPPTVPHFPCQVVSQLLRGQFVCPTIGPWGNGVGVFSFSFFLVIFFSWHEGNVTASTAFWMEGLCLWPGPCRKADGNFARLAFPTLSPFPMCSSWATEIFFPNVREASQAHSTFMKTWNAGDVFLEWLSFLSDALMYMSLMANVGTLANFEGLNFERCNKITLFLN